MKNPRMEELSFWMSGERFTRLDGRLLTSFHGAVFKKSDMPLPKVKDKRHPNFKNNSFILSWNSFSVRRVLPPCQYIYIVAVISRCKYYFFLIFKKREFYFDRSPRIFENILGLYRKGELHLTERVCPRDFLGDDILNLWSRWYNG